MPRSVICDRVRAQISLRLDGELSQLESMMLTAHLLRCEECREFEASASMVTHELRTAPLEPVPHPVVVRRPARTSLGRMHIGVAAALAVVVLGALAQVGSRDTTAANLPAPERYASYTQLTREVEQIIADGRAFAKFGGEALPL